jgi:parallel beta-helix repeat protein
MLAIVLFATSEVLFCDTLQVPGVYAKIQIAIDTASNGDVIQVATGTYLENIDFKGKGITVESESGPAATIIDGDSAFTVVRFQNDEGPDSVIKGFTILNGMGVAGGGIRCVSGASPVVKDNIITQNRASLGAGIYCHEDSSPTIIGNSIVGNRADTYGGGIFCQFDSSPEITGNSISGNKASRGGGIYCLQHSYPIIASNTISANIAENGAGIYCSQSASASITGNLITGNVTYGNGWGGGVYSKLSYLNLEGNSIMGNLSKRGGGIYSVNNTARICNNTIKENTADDGAGIFCEDGKVLRVVGNDISENLSTSSKLGCALFCREMDSIIIDSNTFEFNDSGIHCKSTAGRIEGNSFFFNRGTVLQVNAGGQYIINKNTLTGNMARGIACYGLDSLDLKNNTVCDNLDLALHCKDCSPTVLVGNVISGNVTSAGCAGIYCESSSAEIRLNEIINNQSQNGVGGLQLWSVWGTMEKNLVQGNVGELGGGIQIQNGGSLTVTDNLIEDNLAFEIGGGIYCKGAASPTLTNNIICGNKAVIGGGIGIKGSSDPVITGNTISCNEAWDAGGGLYIKNTAIGMSVVANTILFGNTGPVGPAIALDTGGQLAISHSNVEGGLAEVYLDPDAQLDWGAGMIDADPLFVDQPGGDYHLTYLSPCRGTGDNDAQHLPDHDFEADPRVVELHPDMGADEFHTHLYCTGTAMMGGHVKAKFIGLPGTAPVGLWFGSALLDPPLPSSYGYWYLQPPCLYAGPLGSIPPDGVLIFGAKIQQKPPPPYDLFMQALIGNALTNPFVLEVR